MRLLSVSVEFPAVAVNGGARRVTLPLQPVCKTSASLFGHGPIWQVASVPPGVSWVLETRQRADAQPVGSVDGSWLKIDRKDGRTALTSP